MQDFDAVEREQRLVSQLELLLLQVFADLESESTPLRG